MVGSIQKWVDEELKDVQDEKQQIILNKFWCEYYSYISNTVQCAQNTKMTSKKLYQDEVIYLLNDYKKRNRDIDGNLIPNMDELYQLQKQIENLTMHFDEESIYKSTHNIISILMGANIENARDYLRRKLILEDDISLLNEFGQYTIEAIIVYVLCLLFSSSDILIRVASLVEQLEQNVRTQARILRQSRGGADLPKNIHEKKSSYDKRYPIGTHLVEFMISRKLIIVDPDESSNVIKKKSKSYYTETKLNVICNFDIKLLPVKLNLPMIYPPLEWKSSIESSNESTKLSDLRGGYLTSPSSELYDSYKLLSTKNINNFYIDIKMPTEMCNIMNSLQAQPFKINKKILEFINTYYSHFVRYGLLKPKFIVDIDLKEASEILRDFYMKDSSIKEICTYNDMLHSLLKDIQQARYEKMILTLADAYSDFSFYLPAFLDFRGRIYRSGLLHFHERDLARCLIHFPNSPCNDDGINIVREATSFHYDNFSSLQDGLEFMDAVSDFMKHKELNVGFTNNIEYVNTLIEGCASAKHPFQFLNSFKSITDSYGQLCMDNICIPITQDASASAYQILSYLLLDESIAKRTNLIFSENIKIKDIYFTIY